MKTNVERAGNMTVTIHENKNYQANVSAHLTDKSKANIEVIRPSVVIAVFQYSLLRQGQLRVWNIASHQKSGAVSEEAWYRHMVLRQTMFPVCD